MAFDAKSFLRQLPDRPGVYQMYDASDSLLYVGKAKSLKKRVGNYFRSCGLDTKTVALVSHIDNITITVTHNEIEALLLEQTLIKEHKPPYNVLMRDDKSYPYIYLSAHSDYPLLKSVRGHPNNKKGTFFGPYPNGFAIREAILWLQKTFKIRNCEDSFFQNRSRPCLQYQIKRCSGPCVGLISKSDYQSNVRHVSLFLSGKSVRLLHELQNDMNDAAKNLAFERAAELRDQVVQLRLAQEQQHVYAEAGNLDIVCVGFFLGIIAFYVLKIRHGKVLGGQTFFPKQSTTIDLDTCLFQYVAQNYLNAEQGIPEIVVLNKRLIDASLFQDAWKNVHGKKLALVFKPRGQTRSWMALAETNLQQALSQKSQGVEVTKYRLIALQQALELPNLPSRIECIDISHTFGEAPVASCVVFQDGVPSKSQYRKYHMREAKGGDDCACISETIQRRFEKVAKDQSITINLLLIDGGRGQVNAVLSALSRLKLASVPSIVGVAKGRDRRDGTERLIMADSNRIMQLDSTSMAQHLIQQIRDEAHRFALLSHRAKRGKSRVGSKLDDISGVGAKRRQALLSFFGSYQAIRYASMSEIAKVPGVGIALAQTVYQALHPD